jgi:integrase
MTRWQRRAHTGAIVRFPSTIGPAEPTARLRATVSERLGHSSVATTAKIYAHALRGKDRAAAQVWDDLMQQSRGEVSKGVN